jgi:tungstate transport system ATP-binding protein
MRLDVLHIAKQYEAKTILKDCSFSFDRTGTYILMGRNGCGKSTFLRICSLLEEPDSGTVSFSDNNAFLPSDLALKRRITLVLPRIGIFNTTVFKNAASGLKIRGIPHAEIDRRVNETLAFVGMEHKKDQQARTLSSGEAQRLGIARALVIEPDILFLDEPTASIDQENTEIIESIIHTMKQESRTMVIMTTHDRDQAERLADVLLFMKDGRIEKQ